MMSDNAHEYHVCPRCGRELPLTEEWWYQTTINDIVEYPRWSKFPRYCKKCHAEDARRNYQDHPEVRKRQAIYQRERYQNDPEVRKARKQAEERYRSKPGIKERRRLQQRLHYHRKRGNTARVAELEAELAAMKTKET